MNTINSNNDPSNDGKPIQNYTHRNMSLVNHNAASHPASCDKYIEIDESTKMQYMFDEFISVYTTEDGYCRNALWLSDFLNDPIKRTKTIDLNPFSKCPKCKCKSYLRWDQHDKKPHYACFNCGHKVNINISLDNSAIKDFELNSRKYITLFITIWCIIMLGLLLILIWSY